MTLNRDTQPIRYWLALRMLNAMWRLLGVSPATEKNNQRGWETGFQFSSDFKYIVPKVIPTPEYRNPYIINPAWGTWQLTPVSQCRVE